ncbi:hypothetical protein EYF80_008145 [Liparis tanakae]|uniref:Secreted protein n=1 Tax=Liparis tanakae TaxID=230148 RepID=A0A4Z2IUL0_9TELE|nr:hypothetical protein EYF80_008145 [Liparis tanakae]
MVEWGWNKGCASLTQLLLLLLLLLLPIPSFSPPLFFSLSLHSPLHRDFDSGEANEAPSQIGCVRFCGRTSP